MARLEFNDLSFEEADNDVIVTFLRLFYFRVEKETLKKIGEFKIGAHFIEFEGISENKAGNKLNMVLLNGFKNLRNRINNKRAVYVHSNSGIPLIGNISFGLIDRDTSIIEVKPITSCNLDCIYCSVDQNKRDVDFVIEESYLFREFKKLVEFKAVNGIEAHIASQGEPLLYSPLAELVRHISGLPQVSMISIDTNGTLLTKTKVDELVDAGLTRFNLSINALDKALAEKISGSPYDIQKIMGIARHIAKKSKLIIAPVLIPGINEEEMPKIIEFAKEIKADIGIQNFLNYRLGKNPAKPEPFDLFFGRLKKWEMQFNMRLIKTEQDFNIKKTMPLPKPFKRGDVINARIACLGRFNNEKIAVFGDRTISVPDCHKDNGMAKIKITRTKHNIFIGEL